MSGTQSSGQAPSAELQTLPDLPAGLAAAARSVAAAPGAGGPVAYKYPVQLPRVCAPGLTAMGTMQAQALQLGADDHVITGGAAGAGVMLRQVTSPVWLFNASGSDKQVWPPVGGSINGGAPNAPLVLPAGTAVWVCTADLVAFWVG